jgi:hypothetical protein
MLSGSAVCKDCGNGTLNNELNEQFIEDPFGIQCVRCGSSHMDGDLYYSEEE